MKTKTLDQDTTKDVRSQTRFDCYQAQSDGMVLIDALVPLATAIVMLGHLNATAQG